MDGSATLMNMPTSVKLRRSWLEIILAIIIMLGIVYCGFHVWSHGYLPPPFYYEPTDTFADWFNTAFWARQKAGAYDQWRTVYPPMSFVFLKMLSIGQCYPETYPLAFGPGLGARGCDRLGAVAIVVIFGINIILTRRTFTKVDPATAPMRTICVAMGAPMLYGLERGNLILITYTCLLLALGPLIASARLRWVFAGLAINFKIYTIAPVVALLLKRRWRWVERALLAAVLVYLLSLAVYGEGTPAEILANLLASSAQGTDGWFATTYKPLAFMLDKDIYQFSSTIGSIWANRLMILIPALRWLTLGLIVLACVAIWYRPEAFTPYRAIALGTLAATITSESGGYSMIFFMLFVLMEPWRGYGRRYAIVACYILAIPFDLPIHVLDVAAVSLPLQNNAVTLFALDLPLGYLVRPFIIMSIAWAISLTTLREFWLKMGTPINPGVMWRKMIHCA